MTDMGQLHYFLGVSVTSHDSGLFLSQRQYMLDILERAGMRECKPCNTPVDTHSNYLLMARQFQTLHIIEASQVPFDIHSS